jgi:hypothetical protein
VLNHELYGFYGSRCGSRTSLFRVSCWSPPSWSSSSAEFTVADLTGYGLRFWATGQRPHYDVVYEGDDLESLVARLAAASYRIVDNPASTRRSTEMIYIDLPADLNLEDDEGGNIARLADAVGPDAVIPGAVLVAGTSRAWSWAVVDSVDNGFVYFRQISAQDAARRAPLVKPLPQSA